MEDFWNDVVDLHREPDSRHYMGAVVVEARGDREFLVIDGQQRLATIGILTLAIIRKLHRMPNRTSIRNATGSARESSAAVSSARRIRHRSSRAAG